MARVRRVELGDGLAAVGGRRARGGPLIRWLVAGTGGVGRAHLAALERVPGARIAGVVTLDAPPRDDVPAFRTLGDALRGVECDAVIVATPHDTHRDIALEAIAAGRAVLLEKPVGTSLADAEAVARAARERGVHAGAVLNQRGAAHLAWVRELIAVGTLRPNSVAFSGSIAALRGWHADPRRAGGGVLRTIGLHYLDLLRWWLGEPDTLAALVAGEPIETRIAVAMRFPGGAFGSLQLAAVATRSLGPMRCVIDGEGDARLVIEGHAVQKFENLPPPPPVEAFDAAMPYGPGHLAILRGATQGLESGDGFPLTLQAALPSLRLVELAYASAARAMPA